MIPGDRMLLRIASSIMLVLAVLGATGVAWSASVDLLMWGFSSVGRADCGGDRVWVEAGDGGP